MIQKHVPQSKDIIQLKYALPVPSCFFKSEYSA